VVIRYASRHLSPVVDTTITNYVDLLNPNSYQKGAWFLHMLRKELGDDLFRECIRTYYTKYQYSNALTKDFQSIAESIAGKDLDHFFKQWLYQSGHPVVDIQWQLVFPDGSMKLESVLVNQAENIFVIPVNEKVEKIIPDPEVWLLFEK